MVLVGDSRVFVLSAGFSAAAAAAAAALPFLGDEAAVDGVAVGTESISVVEAVLVAAALIVAAVVAAAARTAADVG